MSIEKIRGQIDPGEVALMWAALEDAVRRWLPELGSDFAYVVAGDLRLGSGGPWEGMVPLLENRRALLLHDVASFTAQRTGEPWPFPDDLLPEVPDDAAGLDPV